MKRLLSPSDKTDEETKAKRQRIVTADAWIFHASIAPVFKVVDHINYNRSFCIVFGTAALQVHLCGFLDWRNWLALGRLCCALARFGDREPSRTRNQQWTAAAQRMMMKEQAANKKFIFGDLGTTPLESLRRAIKTGHECRKLVQRGIHPPNYMTDVALLPCTGCSITKRMEHLADMTISFVQFPTKKKVCAQFALNDAWLCFWCQRNPAFEIVTLADAKKEFTKESIIKAKAVQYGTATYFFVRDLVYKPFQGRIW